MKNALLLFITLAILPNSLVAQNINEMEKESRYVEVTGVAEMEVVPDEIYISITLQEEKDGMKRTVEAQEKELIKAIKALDIDLDNLKLSNVGSYTRWDKKNQTSYKQKTFELMVPDAAKASSLLYELNQLELNRMYVARTNHSKVESYRKQVKIDAVKAAKDKAEYLLEAVDEEVGEVLYIVEQDYNNYGYRAMGASNIYSVERQDSYTPESEITFQMVKLQYKILARFAIQ